MKGLRNLLSESSKSRRRRRNLLNIQITMLAWLVEIFGFVVVFVGSFILGHNNNITTFLMQAITLLFYTVITPSMYLINGTEFKSIVVESNWYQAFLRRFSLISSGTEDESCQSEGHGQIQNETERHDVNVGITENCHGSTKNDEEILFHKRTSVKFKDTNLSPKRQLENLRIIDLEENNTI